MIIRPAEPRDAAAIAAIWNAEIRDGISTFNSVAKPIAEVDALIVERGDACQEADVDGEVVGFATYYAFRGGVGYAKTKEHSIYINDAGQGRGIGRALMAALVTVAQQEGVHTMIAAISGENGGAQRFHAALGFKQVAHVPEVGYKFNRWMDLVLMQKHL